MNRLVTARVAESTDWRAVVDRGLRQAKAQSDIPGFVLMVQLICQILEGDGRLEDGLAEVDHALNFASNSADIGAILNGLKASMQAAMGRPDDAKRTLAKGLAALPRASAEAGVRYRVFRKVALWQSFEDETGEPATALVKACAELGLERDRAFLVSWYVPWLANIGDRRTAHPIIRDLRQEAADAHSMWRLSDAVAFGVWDSYFGSDRFDPAIGEVDRRNALAVWRAEGVRLRDAMLRADSDRCSEGLQKLVKARRRLSSAEVGTIEQFEAAVAITSGSLEELRTGSPPARSTLVGLGAVLAEAESVAYLGSQRACGEWSERLDAILPGTAMTSLAWPVSRLRIVGLLALRAGNVNRARVLLQDAVDWTAAQGFVVENALSRLQLGELCASAEVKVPERTWKTHRREGAEAMRQHGYNPLPHVYAAAHSLTLSGRNRLAERLTPREVQVLGLLADGTTYAEAASALSIEKSSVQTLAHRVYQKLGVSGKDAAVQEAKRLGVL